MINEVGSRRVALLMPAYNCQADMNASISELPIEEPLHVLIVDDGSTPPLEAPPCHPTHSVRMLRNSVNLKIHGALRRGMEVLHAEGFQYVARLDAGDFALPMRFRLQKDFLDAHPEVAAIGSAVELVSEQGRLLAIWRPPLTDDAIRRFRLLRSTLGHPAVMLRAEAVLAVGNYRDTHPCAEDLDLFLRLMQRFKVANLPRVLGRKVEHTKSITVRQRRQMIVSAIRLQFTHLRPGCWADWAGVAKSVSQLLMPRSVFEVLKLRSMRRMRGRSRDALIPNDS